MTYQLRLDAENTLVLHLRTKLRVSWMTFLTVQEAFLRRQVETATMDPLDQILVLLCDGCKDDTQKELLQNLVTEADRLALTTRLAVCMGDRAAVQAVEDITHTGWHAAVTQRVQQAIHLHSLRQGLVPYLGRMAVYGFSQLRQFIS